jgi:Bacterial TSP3 repeat
MQKHNVIGMQHSAFRAVAAVVFSATLAACGGGSDEAVPVDASVGVDATAEASDDVREQALAVPVTPACVDPTATLSSSIRFDAPTGAAVGKVVLSGNGMSACFKSASAVGVKSNGVVKQGPNSLHYFEATRTDIYNTAIGVSGTPDATPPNGSNFVPTADTLWISGTHSLTADLLGNLQYGNIGNAATFGVVVDYRSKYPVISIIGPASGSWQCDGLPPTTPCVLTRTQLPLAPASLYIHAHGVGSITDGPRVSINPGTQLVNKPYAYSPQAVRQALRTKWFAGDRGLNMQWPTATGAAASSPSLTRVGYSHAVIRQGDATAFRKSLAVTPVNGSTGVVQWTHQSGTSLATGNTLSLTVALINSLAPGEHQIKASLTHPTTGRYTETVFRLTVLSSVMNTDDDNDGLSYDQEKALTTDPGNPDTDNDGLSDGAETALGTKPKIADTDKNGVKDGFQLAGDSTLPLRGALTIEAGANGTSSGLVIGDDGLSVAFTSELNPECVNRQGIFANALYAQPDRCMKRAIRANTGVKKGEFRYFETRRLGPLENIGHGYITPGSMINPYCCFVGEGEPGFPYTASPPSLAINSIGGVVVNLSYYGGSFELGLSLDQTEYYGFAVDYRGAEPVTYMVVRGWDGSLSVSDGVLTTGFNNLAAMPMLYGHPNLDNEARASMNLGLHRFHYDLTAVRAALTAKGVGAAAMVPGVGVHRWQ